MAGLPHILMVEDDPTIATLVCKFLERSGFRTTHPASGAEVAKVLTEDQPDLVLLDVLLQGEDGLSIARRVRTSHPTPIILFDGHERRA